jgi:hypothetical protein
MDIYDLHFIPHLLSFTCTYIYIYSIFEMEDDGFVVPDKITSLKLPVRGKKSSNKLIAGATASYADVPDGIEECRSEDEKEGCNDYEADPDASKSSAEKTSSPTEDKLLHEYISEFHEDSSDSNRDINLKKISIGSNDSSSTSKSDYNDEKSIGKKRGNRKNPESSAPKKKPRATKVDVTAMLL